MGAGLRPAAPRGDRRARAGWHPAALSIATRAGGEGREVRGGIGRHATSVPRREAQRHGCVAGPLGSARRRHGAAGHFDGCCCRGAADRLRQPRQSADRAGRGAAARAGAAGRGLGWPATDHSTAADREPAPRPLGAALGLVLATWGASVLLGYFTTPEAPVAVTPDPDARILLFTSGLAVATALIAGIMPAFRSSRVDVAPALKSAGGSVGGEQPRLRKTLVVAQVALSFTLLIGAGLFVRSLNNLLATDPGFRTTQMLTFSFDLSRAGYKDERSHAFATRFLDAASRVPGVSSAAYAFQSLLTGGGWGMGFSIEGYQPRPGEDAGSTCNAVSPGFFRTLGIPLLAGREFTERDARVVPLPEGWPYRSAVVNQSFVERYFKGA